jgi:putative intracellular protease/amidase
MPIPRIDGHDVRRQPRTTSASASNHVQPQQARRRDLPRRLPDLVNAGATWVDGVVVEDGNLITSRKPDDLDAFSQTILKRIEEPLVAPRN